MQATEQTTTESAGQEPRAAALETHAQNDRMRHIPSAQWLIHKLDIDIRQKVEKLLVPYSDLPSSDPRHAPIEAELRALCRAIERVGDIAKRHHRGNHHPPNDLASRIGWTISHAVANLTAMDGEAFGRRYPFHTFERSNAEPLWGAMLCAIDHLHRLIERMREVDPEIDERLYEGLVVLQTPMDARPMA